jgi:hypothetical protein
MNSGNYSFFVAVFSLYFAFVFWDPKLADEDEIRSFNLEETGEI